MRDGRVKKGDLLACCGFGAGLTWGGAVPWCRGGAERGDAGADLLREHWCNTRII